MARAKKKKRIVFRVGPVSPRKGRPYLTHEWAIMRGSKQVGTRTLKREAVRSARTMARIVHSEGGLSQLVIHGTDGRIQTEYTYGADPKRSPG